MEHLVRKLLLSLKIYSSLLLFCFYSCSGLLSCATRSSKKTQKISTNNPTNVLAIALDADGCVFNREYVKAANRAACQQNHFFCLDAKEKQHTTILLKHNQKLIDHINQQIATEAYDTIIFLIASWRQTFRIDQFNAMRLGRRHKTALFFETMPILVDAIKQKNETLSPKIAFDTYLITDTLQGVPSGTYYGTQAESEKMNGKVNNRTKEIIVENHKKYLQEKFPGATICYNVYDDHPDLYEAYLNNKNNLSKGFHVAVFSYNGKHLQLFRKMG